MLGSYSRPHCGHFFISVTPENLAGELIHQILDLREDCRSQAFPDKARKPETRPGLERAGQRLPPSHRGHRAARLQKPMPAARSDVAAALREMKVPSHAGRSLRMSNQEAR